ncbi:MAG: acyl-CoA dehydrogenase family protein, partial [Chloroflexota bacterium]
MALAKDQGALLDSVRALRPLVLDHADASEKSRRMAMPVVEALRDAGVFRMLVPRGLGGREVHPLEFLSVLEELATADASAAWTAMIGSTSGLTCAFLDEAAAREILGDSPGLIGAGVVAPRGTATSVDGGFRVNGRWPFASGSLHSQWIGLSCVYEKDGAPTVLYATLPMSEVEVHDTWDVAGLRATGSVDVSAHDVFVPESRGFYFLATRPKHDGLLYAFSLRGLLAVAVASVALGVGRAALDDLRELAGEKTPTGRNKPLVEWAITQVKYAQAEAALRSGRAFLIESIESMWETLERGDKPTSEQAALIRLAATAATDGSVRFPPAGAQRSA